MGVGERGWMLVVEVEGDGRWKRRVEEGGKDEKVELGGGDEM